MPHNDIRVVIVDQYASACMGISRMIARADIQVVGMAATRSALRLRLAALAPTEILLNLNLPLDP